VFFWTKQCAACETMSKEWRQNESLTRGNRYVGMRRSEAQESDRSKNDRQSDNTSLRITKCEIYIDNHVYHRWRRVSYALYCDIVELRALSQKDDASRSSYGHWFCLAATIEIVREQCSFSRVHQ
jgi:hypothetical protein